MMATLGIAGFFSGLALVGIFLATAPLIERNRAAALEAAIYRVLPGAQTRKAFVVREGRLTPFESPGGTLPKEEAVYAGYDEEGNPLGFAIPAEGPGFQDTIKLLYGYDPSRRRVVGMEVLESKETPGLGDKIFKDLDFVANFHNLAVDPEVVVTKKGRSQPPLARAASGARHRTARRAGPIRGGAGTVRGCGRHEGVGLMPATKNPRDEFRRGIWKEHPVFVQLLGLCPALAVTNSAINGLAMGAATTFVIVGSSLFISSLRNLIPKQVRITSFIIVIASFVTITDFTLQALAPTIHKELGAFIALIVVNCLILGRQEAFASRNPVPLALSDAGGMAIGFTFSLVLLGGIREILGNGTLFGVSLFGPSFEPWVIMILPPGGFLTLGLLMGLFAHVKARRLERAKAAAGEAPERRAA
jgi:electron transport complex protein RnfE